MDRLAGNYLSSGDVANASSLYDSLEKLNPTKYSRMARICRVLSNPQSVPLPHRYDDICEALLDPAVPPEVLLRSCPEDVQKSFQRLAVCVHPDKNPNARAKDAFLRLSHMKDKALQLLEAKADGHASSAAPAASPPQTEMKAATAAPTVAGSGVRRPQRPPLGGAHTNNTSNNNNSNHINYGSPGNGAAAGKRRPLRHTTPPLTPVTELQGAAMSVSSGLEQLRHTTIKLNCFKRKDIAEDFEIFSATQRTGQGSALGSSDTSLAECGEESLAATVPVLPRGKKTPLTHRRPQPPVKPAGTAAKTPAHRLATPLPRPVSSSDFSTSGATPPSATTPVLTPAGRMQPTSTPLPPALPRIGEAALGDGSGEAAVGEADGVAGTFRPASAAVVANDEAIRQQIDATCLRLREMRTQNTNIRLTLDLSFEAYQRSKQDN